jgi:hypoxanthine phosphoribosyltransferase
METYHPEVLISEEDVALKVQELGARISQDFEGEDLVVICILKGAFLFCSDLIRQINLPVSVEFMSLSSYGDDTVSSGEVKVNLDLTGSITDKNVLIVEDIVDSGLTMKYLKNNLIQRKPKTLKVASLLHKSSKTIYETEIDYLAFEIEDKFVVGYGLDYAGRYRELPYIGILNAGH